MFTASKSGVKQYGVSKVAEKHLVVTILLQISPISMERWGGVAQLLASWQQHRHETTDNMDRWELVRNTLLF
jgi:hypothetical protein